MNMHALYCGYKARMLCTGLSRFAVALMCFSILLFMAPVAHAQDNSFKEALRGTLCDDPQDENTKSACTIAMTHCIFATMYGRTDQERNRILRTCMVKTATQMRRAMNAQGNAVRRAYGGETDAQVAADLAAKKKAREKADAEAAAEKAKYDQKMQLAEQQRIDTVNRACTTGEGTIVARNSIFIPNPYSIRAVYIGRDSTLTPVADQDAVAKGKCSVQIIDGRHQFIAQVSIWDLDGNGLILNSSKPTDRQQ